MNLYLVAYEDDRGPYAAAFSTRALADEFVRDFAGPDAIVIETELNLHTEIERKQLRCR